MLIVEDLHTYYGKVCALYGINIEVNDGDMVAVIGSNGAGKTTLLRTISGFIHPTSGKIEYQGKNITNSKPHAIVRGGISHCPEGRHLFVPLSVIDNLQMGAFQLKDRKQIKINLERVFSLFPILSERKNQLAGTLSGGEQQMLAIARAIMANPTLLLMDEPSLGLAPIVVRKIFETLVTLHREGVTILLVEQNARMSLAIADRAYVLENGRVKTKGTGKDLLTDNEIIKAYLGGNL